MQNGDAKCRTTDVTSWVVLSTVSSMAGCFAPKNAPWFVRLARYTALSMMQTRASTLKLNSGHLTKKGSYYLSLMYPLMISSFFSKSEANELTKKITTITTSNLKASLRLEQEAYLQDNALLALSACSSPTTSWFSAWDNKRTSQSIKIYITWNQKEPKTPPKKWHVKCCRHPQDALRNLFKDFFSLLQELPHKDIPQPTTAGNLTKPPMGPKALMAKCAADQIQSKACKVCLVYVSFFSSYGVCREKKGRFLHTTSNLCSHLLPVKLLKSSGNKPFTTEHLLWIDLHFLHLWSHQLLHQTSGHTGEGPTQNMSITYLNVTQCARWVTHQSFLAPLILQKDLTPRYKNREPGFFRGSDDQTPKPT